MYHPLKVKQVRRLTDKSVSLEFDIPASLTTQFEYQAGQYISLEETIDGATVRRSYSICTAPSEDRLAVGIKQIPNGVFSTHANQEIVAGSILSVAPPEGRFVLREIEENTSYTGIVAGSGITPVIAIAKEVLRQTQKSSFYLVYGNKTPHDEMFKDEIDTLVEAFPDRFTVLRTYSQTTVSGAGAGRIDSPILEQLADQSGLQSKAYFLCGPEAMISRVSGTLQKKGVLSDHIHFELFTSSASEKTSVKSEGFRLQITCDAVQYDLEGGPGQTILDVALQNKIDVPYSCQGGVCSSCIARVTKGQASMRMNQILTDGEIEEGLVLTCQAQADTVEIEVDFDDI